MNESISKNLILLKLILCRERIERELVKSSSDKASFPCEKCPLKKHRNNSNFINCGNMHTYFVLQKLGVDKNLIEKCANCVARFKLLYNYLDKFLGNEQRWKNWIIK